MWYTRRFIVDRRAPKSYANSHLECLRKAAHGSALTVNSIIIVFPDRYTTSLPSTMSKGFRDPTFGREIRAKEMFE